MHCVQARTRVPLWGKRTLCKFAFFCFQPVGL